MECTYGRSYGPENRNSLWVSSGCRGSFSCNDGPIFTCEQPQLSVGEENPFICMCPTSEAAAVQGYIVVYMVLNVPIRNLDKNELLEKLEQFFEVEDEKFTIHKAYPAANDDSQTIVSVGVKDDVQNEVSFSKTIEIMSETYKSKNGDMGDIKILALQREPPFTSTCSKTALPEGCYSDALYSAYIKNCQCERSLKGLGVFLMVVVPLGIAVLGIVACCRMHPRCPLYKSPRRTAYHDPEEGHGMDGDEDVGFSMKPGGGSGGSAKLIGKNLRQSSVSRPLDYDDVNIDADHISEVRTDGPVETAADSLRESSDEGQGEDSESEGEA